MEQTGQQSIVSQLQVWATRLGVSLLREHVVEKQRKYVKIKNIEILEEKH